MDDLEISKIILSQIQDYKEEVKSLKSKLSNETIKDVNNSLSSSQLENTLFILDNFDEIIKEATIEEKRDILFSIIENIVWVEEVQKLNIIYKKIKDNR